MTESEAIQLASEHIEWLTDDPAFPRCLKIAEAIKMAIEALEKQIPKKPIADAVDMEYAECPSCAESVVDHYGSKYKFCPGCGQRIDWSESEES